MKNRTLLVAAEVAIKKMRYNGMANMNNRLIGMMVALTFAGMVTSARGGSLDAPAAPTNSASAMWTLKDIYDVLDTRTTNVTKRAGAEAFAEPTAGPTNGTMHTLNDIMTLVTNRVPVGKTGQKISYLTGDDGWCSTNVGVAWPNPRFTTNNIDAAGTNVVTDNLTGLMWTRNANLDGQKDWTNAISYCTNMNSGAGTYGYTDWRLPNVRELHSLISYEFYNPPLCNTAGTAKWSENDPFTGVQSSEYWSSASRTAGTDRAWYVKLYYGYVYDATKVTVYYVWPVRGGGN